jgi:hypothetical protein
MAAGSKMKVKTFYFSTKYFSVAHINELCVESTRKIDMQAYQNDTYACEIYTYAGRFLNVLRHAAFSEHTAECDFNTHKCDFSTQSEISTRTNVILTRTSVISTRIVVISTRRV